MKRAPAFTGLRRPAGFTVSTRTRAQTLFQQTTGTKEFSARLVSPQRGALYEDAHGNLWLGASEPFQIVETNGEFALRKVELNFPDRSWKNRQITDFFEAGDGSLWMSAARGLMRRLPDARIVFYPFGENENLVSALADDAGRIWFASDKGVYVFRPETIADAPNVVRSFDLQSLESDKENLILPEQAGEVVKIADRRDAEGNFRQLYRTTDDHIWITAVNSLLEFDGKTLRVYGAAQGLTAQMIRMAEDASGNLWLGGQSGVTRLDRRGMSAFDRADGLGSSSIHSVFSKNEQLYAVNGDGFVSRFDGKGFETARLEIAPQSVFSWTSNVGFLDGAGEWWVLTVGKLYRFAAPARFADLSRQKPIAVYTSADGLPGDLFYRMFEDSRGHLWICTRDRDTLKGGLTAWTRTDGRFHAFSGADGLPEGKLPSSFAEDAAGNLYFGFYEGGLVRFRDGRFAEIKENLPEGFLTALHFDKKGRLWLASSQSGVSRADDAGAAQPVFVRYTTANGLSSNNVRSLAEAANGDIYVGTARGVDRLAPETGSVEHFSINDGLSGDFVVAAARDAGNDLWFGTPGGLSRLKTETRQPKDAPGVWLSGLRVAGESRYVPPLGAREIGGLELAAGQNNLQVDFFGVHFDAEPLRYQYKLEGADMDWSAPTAQRTVNYANLAPGDYRFLVRAVNAENLPSANPAVVSLNVLAPFYRRPWFVAAIVLLAAAAIFALDRYRVKKTREVETALAASRQSERIARESEARYRTLAETASDAIVTIDEDSRIVYTNEAIEKIFGYPPAELIGENLTKLMPAHLRGEHENGFRRYLSTSRKNLVRAAIELPGRHKNGDTIPLELSFGEFAQDGKRFFTGVARDVSERKRAEAALEKARHDRLAELERVRSRIARDLHDDVGSSLTQIALFSEVAKQGESGANKEPLEFLVQTSNELVEAMSDIVWAINPQKDRFHDLTQRMRRFASEILTAAEIDLDFVAPEPGADAPLGANLRREVFLIFKEAVNNVVKHSRATAVEIEFSAADGFLNLAIGDNGRGFEVAENSNGDYDWRAAKGGNGVPGMRRRAADLGGDFSVESRAGGGTKIILRVPLEINLETISPD